MVARVGQDDVGDLLVAGVDVDVRAFGQACLDEDLFHDLCRAGALRGVLEQDGVAQGQVRGGEAGDLVVGEVPRHDAQQRADGLAADHGGGVLGSAQWFVGHEGFGVVSEVLVDHRAQLDFALAFGHGFAHFELDDFGELFGAFGVDLGHAGQQCGALGYRGPAPLVECRRRTVEGGEDLGVGGGGEFFGDLAGRRVGDAIHGGHGCPLSLRRG